MKKKKSLPLTEGSTKTNVRKHNNVGRQAPPPPVDREVHLFGMSRHKKK